MVKESQGSILMNHYVTQRTSSLNKDTNTFSNATSFGSSVADPSPTPDVRQSVWSSQSMRTNKADNQVSVSSGQPTIDAWIEEEQSNMKLQKECVTAKEKTNFFKCFSGSTCSPTVIVCFLGLIIGSLLAGIALTVLLTIWLNTTTTSTAVITSTTSTTVTTSTTTTTTTTTTQASAVAHSSLASYCGCSSFTLSLTNASFGTTNTTYQWQSSPMGQNSWSNINSSSTSSSLSVTSQVNSTDYQCQIIVLHPTPRNLTSTVVTVITTTYTSYCQTRLVNCNCCGDDINNFIMIGELSTQINDLATNCSANSYDNRTQESVSLYQGNNYTAQASSQFSGGNERLAIWIDFNNNFQFESSEQVAYQILNLTYNTNVIMSIPSSSGGAITGVHRMRATLAYGSLPNSCGTSSTYGETHDYTVNILTPVG